MMVGNKAQFAIESGISEAYARLSFRGLGFFVIHLREKRYGVCKPNATMLACSFDEVVRRIARRGSHTAPFAIEADAGRIADCYRNANYASDQENKRLFGITQPRFRELLSLNHIAWAPDGDAAFDDGSYVLHFDIKDRVRLIAFKGCLEGYNHDPRTLSEVWLRADEFYRILEKWRETFEAEWARMPKALDNETDIAT